MVPARWLVAAAMLASWSVTAGAGERSVEEMSQRIDALLAARYLEEGIEPAPLAEDSEFLRRACLDLIGVIPTVGQTRAFLADSDPDKRSKLIDQLLASPRHPTHLANVWRDIILPPSFEAGELNQAAGLQRWLRRQFAMNLRYDRLVSEFLAAGGNEENGPAIFYRALQSQPEKLAASTARIFLGSQIQCAECHDHPFDHWTQRDFWGYAAFFARLRRPDAAAGDLFELVDLPEGEVTLPETDQVVLPKYPGGRQADPDPPGTRRLQLSIWMASRDNPYLARAAVNRVWALLFGRGLVNPVDDLGPANPSSHPELFEQLTDYFIASGFDLRQLLRTLARTEAYQRSSKGEAAGETADFVRMAVKPLTADQLYESLRRVFMPEPEDARSEDVQRQGFLARMQVASRDATEYRLGVQQALLILNGPLVGQAVNPAPAAAPSGLLAALQAPFFDDKERLDTLYLATLSRYPRSHEEQTLLAFLKTEQQAGRGDEAWGDILWALLNSAEFQLNH